jgi:hypothetical protein
MSAQGSLWDDRSMSEKRPRVRRTDTESQHHFRGVVSSLFCDLPGDDLAKVADCQLLGDGDRAIVGSFLANHHTKQRCLARPIGSQCWHVGLLKVARRSGESFRKSTLSLTI